MFNYVFFKLIIPIVNQYGVGNNNGKIKINGVINKIINVGMLKVKIKINGVINKIINDVGMFKVKLLIHGVIS
jgi:hypothetical protein